MLVLIIPLSKIKIMKKLLILSLCLLSAFLFQNCRKSTNGEISNPKSDFKDDIPLGAPPLTIPQILTNIELDAQLRHLAAGFALVFANGAVNQYGTVQMMDVLTSNIASSDNELPIATYHNYVMSASWSGYKFALSGGIPITDDLYDAVNYCKSTYVYSPSISPSWKADFYTHFTIASDEYYTLLRIPEFIDQGIYTNASKPIIFLGENVRGVTTYNGYQWNNSTNTVQVITGLNDDIIEAHIDNNTAYIVVVGYEKKIDGLAGGRVSSSCEGGWSCFDDYCDEACGELLTCIDCQALRKKLYLKAVRINNDERVSKGNILTVLDCHFVDNLGGKYKLALNSVVLHGNGKWVAINREDIRPKWKQSEVHRVKIRNNGTRRSKGTNTWKTVFLKGDAAAEAAGKGILLAENFNPYKAKVFIQLAEEDNLFGQERDFFPPDFLGTPISNNQDWKSQGMPTLTGPAKGSFDHDDLTNPAIWDLIEAMSQIDPSDWLDPVTGALRDEIEITRVNVTFVLKYE